MARGGVPPPSGAGPPRVAERRGAWRAAAGRRALGWCCLLGLLRCGSGWSRSVWRGPSFCGQPAADHLRPRAGRPAARQPHVAMGAKKFYRALTKIKVRIAPDVSSPSLADSDSNKLRSGEWVGAMDEGKVFEVSEERAGLAGQVFLKLANQEGWVFTRGVAGRWSGQEVALQVREGLERDAEAEAFVQGVERQTFRNDTEIGLFALGMAILVTWIVGTVVIELNSSD
ncbi:unnamed protein product [Prorocentrum cordatum]|uniref:Uncharacterized protein n=1 Tax=Prorocentrum cordatum TaxID=2364126 RepID=A0ABN9V165_9DINO|nr:unnamed protein product [Polarella glacialis]